MDSQLEWLQTYFGECCNGDWEHTYQIKIETLDNPGWSLEIDVRDTDLEDAKFDKVTVQKSEDDWLICRVQDGVFRGDGGVKNLTEIIQLFRAWVEANDR